MVDINLVLEEFERAIGALMKDKLILIAENKQLKQKIYDLEKQSEEVEVEG